jgi:hypothetical protein
MDTVPYLIFLGTALAVALILLNREFASPIIAIFSRWLRWIVLSMAFAYLAQSFGWSGRPFWVLATTFFLAWFLLETLYNWLAVTALSRSDIPLFPRFSRNVSGLEWPMQKRVTWIRDWLHENDFRKSQALEADLGMDLRIRSCVYDNPDRTIRLQVIFIPSRSGMVSACCSFLSQTASGARLITDNLFLPFGGFYPENWQVVRCPWRRSPTSLLHLHQKRLKSVSEEVSPIETDPVDDMNHQQAVLERVNTDLGFLIPAHLRDEHGKITWEGRYRVWKEVWLLSYFGATNRY